jgi:hypothetical protein
MEAWSDDLDAIALTEHLEYRPHLAELTARDHNRAFELADPLAQKLGILHIKGCEITRMVPPGHLNAVFVEDCNRIFNPSGNPNPGDSTGYPLAVREAVRQGGFVFFNHPYYRLAHDRIALPKSVERLMDEGLVGGIELINENRYIPQSFTWALEKNLTMLATSDAHSSIPLFNREFGLKHRPLTLVFAEERSLPGILKALKEQRTLIWWNDLVMGRRELAEAFARACIHIRDYRIENGRLSVRFENLSSVPFHIEMICDDTVYVSQAISLQPDTEIILTADILKKETEPVSINFRINNVWIADRVPLMLEYNF